MEIKVKYKAERIYKTSLFMMDIYILGNIISYLFIFILICVLPDTSNSENAFKTFNSNFCKYYEKV